jgi:putative flippase GtrA
MSLIKKFKKFKSFLSIGLLAVGLDYSVYSAFIFNGFSISLSKLMGFVFGTCFSFIGNKNITFRSPFSKKNLLKHFLLYTLTLNLNILINNILFECFSGLEYAKEYSFFLTTGIGALINFLGLNYFVFTNNKNEEL